MFVILNNLWYFLDSTYKEYHTVFVCLCPWDFPGKNTGVVCHFLLKGIFPTQGSSPCRLCCRQTLYRLGHQGSPQVHPRAADGKFCYFCDRVVFHYAHTHVCVCVCVCVYHIFFIHSNVNGHLVCFSVLTTVNKTAKNIRVPVSF